MRTAGRWLFGDRRGLVLFLGCVCVFGLYWRAGIFITDTATLIRTLDAMAQGRLWLDQVGPETFSAPGAVVEDGIVYGRNYGQVALSLPVLLALDGLSQLADLRVGLTALWHVALLGFVVQLSRLRRVRPVVLTAGCLAVFGSFVLNLAIAHQFVEVSRLLLALQVVTMLTAGLLSVLTYRLVAWRYRPGLGLVAGGAAVLVLPVGLWAGFPKRHVLVALLLVGIVYSFARSRERGATVTVPLLGVVPGHRATAYALVGGLAWVHAGEAVFVFAALVAVDLPTAPANDRRTLAVVAGAFCLALLPTVVTNVLISGQPFTPPRLLEPASHVSGTAADSSLGGVIDVESVQHDNSDLSSLPRPVAFVASVVLGGIGGLMEPDRLYHTWIRSGQVDLIRGGNAAFAGANVTVVESIPLFGAFAVVLVTVARTARTRFRGLIDGVEATDALVVAFTTVFVLMYTPRLPIHVQISVRYLLPTYPLLLYLVVRLSAVRALVADRGRLVGWTYAAGVLLGTQLLLAVAVGLDLTVASAVQVHARLALGLAAALALAILVCQFDDRAEPIAAVALGLAAAAGTAFLLLSGMAYFSFVGEYALPAADAVADVVGRI